MGSYDSSHSVLPYSQTLSTLASTASSDNAGHAAGTLASGYAASTVEQWLNQFGAARVRLNMDDHGHWDDSSLDMFLPLYDNQKSVLFTQLGIRAPDNRITGNAGLGVRTFDVRNWMFGGNVFLDNDFSGQNRRVGIGAEAWTDYLKLAINTYTGTTGWHHSDNLKGYNEKPADGFDARIEGWLPQWPQLGAHGMYEKYYGRNVALFSKEHLQKDPSAFTTGLSYTPIPLLTIGGNYRVGKDHLDEFRFGLDIRVAFGQSWSSQVTSDSVGQMRTLAGSRYDLVDRNNDIILQYQKKADDRILASLEINTLKNNSPADGVTTDSVRVRAVTSDGRPVRNASLIWSVTGHGKLSSTVGVTDTGGYAVVNVTDTTSEHVVITATSGVITRTVPLDFTPSVNSLSLNITRNNSAADDHEQNAGVVTVKDASGKVMPAVAITWKVNHGAHIAASDNVTDAHGQATVHFTGTVTGKVNLTATASGKSQSVTSMFSSTPVSNVAVSVTTNNVPADGTTTDTAQAKVTSAAGKPLAGVSVTWSVTKGGAKASTPLTVTTDANGVATVSLTDTTVEGNTVTASAGGKTGTATAEFVAVPVSNVAVSVTTNNVPADGTTTDTAQAKVTSAAGKPLAGVS
ncbi:inverse autotransporter beta domain-containing protein, partial [Enterobacter cancerogenus]